MRPAIVPGFGLALLMALSPSVPAAAQPAPGLTLADAVSIALDRSPLLQAGQQQVKAAEAGIERARAEFLPKLDVLEGATYSNSPVFVFSSKLNQGRFTASDFAIDRLNHPDATDNYRTAVSVSQPLFTGGKASIGLERARLGRDAAAHGLDRRRQEVSFRTARAYYGVLLADAELGVVQAALAAAEANRDAARARFDAGLVVESDVLAAEVRRAELRQGLIVAENRGALARASLNEVMGRALDEPVDVADRLEQRPPAHPPGPRLEALALAERPDYRRLRTEERSQERAIAAAKAEFLPTVEATASWELNNADVVTNGQDGWFAGVLLRWNLFNGFGDRARVTQARAQAAEAGAQRAALASRIGLEVKEATLVLRAAEERIAVARGAIGQAEEALRIVRDRYQTGLTTVVTLLGSEASLTEVRASLARALYDYSVGVANLELALGTIGKESFR